MQSVSIVDVLGNRLFTHKVPMGEASTRINLSSLSAGNYMVEITTSDGLITQKLIKE